MCEKKDEPPIFNAYEAMVRQSQKENCQCKNCTYEKDDYEEFAEKYVENLKKNGLLSQSNTKL